MVVSYISAKWAILSTSVVPWRALARSRSVPPWISHCVVIPRSCISISVPITGIVSSRHSSWYWLSFCSWNGSSSQMKSSSSMTWPTSIASRRS